MTHIRMIAALAAMAMAATLSTASLAENHTYDPVRLQAQFEKFYAGATPEQQGNIDAFRALPVEQQKAQYWQFRTSNPEIFERRQGRRDLREDVRSGRPGNDGTSGERRTYRQESRDSRQQSRQSNIKD